MEEYCEIGFGGYDECPELWFSIYIIDDDGNDLLDNGVYDVDGTVHESDHHLIRMGEFPILHKLEHPDEYISVTRDDDDDKSVFHIS